MTIDSDRAEITFYVTFDFDQNPDKTQYSHVPHMFTSQYLFFGFEYLLMLNISHTKNFDENDMNDYEVDFFKKKE